MDPLSQFHNITYAHQYSKSANPSHAPLGSKRTIKMIKIIYSHTASHGIARLPQSGSIPKITDFFVSFTLHTDHVPK